MKVVIGRMIGRVLVEKTRKFLAVFSLVALVSLVVGPAISIFNLPVAEAVTAVTLSDADAEGYGLDGRDFTVSWTPAGSQPVGFGNYAIYITSNTVADSLTTTNLFTNGCSGSACTPSRSVFNYGETSATLFQSTDRDSTNTVWNAGTSYKACVYTSATTPELACSAVMSNLTSDDAVSDGGHPFVNFIPVHTITESADAIFHAVIMDDQTLAAAFNNTGDAGDEYAQLCYGVDVSTSETCVNGVLVTGDLFKFTAVDANVPAAGNTIEYYIKANDSSNNAVYFCADWESTTAVLCQASPFIANVVAAGARSVGGKVTSSGVALEGAKVFLGGLAAAAVTTDASGDYSISGVVDNNAYDVVAYMSGYCDAINSVQVVGGNATANVSVPQGACVYGGEGEEKPHVTFSSPPPFDFNAPMGEPILVGVSDTLNSSTVNAMDATSSQSNVWLTTDDGSTKIAGMVFFCVDSADTSANCANLRPDATNVIVFQPQASLTENTSYSLVINENVRNDAGHALDGRPNGGYILNFTTGGGTYTPTDVSSYLWDVGEGGSHSAQYMPPFVMNVVPSPGIAAPTNTKIVIGFNERMDSVTLSTGSIKLLLNGEAVATTLSTNTEGDVVTLTPTLALTANTEYDIQVLGMVSNVSGVSMRGPAFGNEIAFASSFMTTSGTDTTPPTIYALTADKATGVSVSQGFFEFGFNEPLNPSAVTSNTITMRRGANSVTADVEYDPGMNSVFVTPTTSLSPNTSYSIAFGTGVTNISGVALAASQTFTFTTGAVDTVAPNLEDVRCDDFRCEIRFNEPMNHDTQNDSNWASSVLNHANLTLTSGGSDLIGASANIAYDPLDFSVIVENLSGLSINGSFVFTAVSALTDLSTNNTVNTTSGANVFNGVIEDPAQVFGDFGGMGGGGMFNGMMGTAGTDMNVGDMFMPGDFGNFTVDNFMFGGANEVFPFNNTAGQDCNVMQVRFTGVALQNDDQLVLTYPSPFTVANTTWDVNSPFKADMNEKWDTTNGTVTFDTAFGGGDGVLPSSTAKTVTVQFAVTGTPNATDQYTIDLRKITNPSIPKGPETGGYSVSGKIMRAGAVVSNLDFMPIFIKGGGSNSITLKVYAGTVDVGTAGADGDIFLWGGGPSGPMDKLLTLTDGITTAAGGDAIAGDAGVVYSSLSDGCYHIGTEPFITLNSVDYFGQDFPEPVCVSGGQDVTKKITLSAASSVASQTLTVKIVKTGGFGGVDIDIFAGGPGRFIVKTLSNVDVPAAAGYDIELPGNGFWHVGIGPSMPKGTSMAEPDWAAFGGMPPPPTEVQVTGLPASGAVSAGGWTPHNVAFDDLTDIVTFTVNTSSVEIPVKVTDGTNNLGNVNVNAHQQGFGAGGFGTTDSSGNVTLKVADYGPYEIEAFMPGLGSVRKFIDVRNESGTKIYVNGVLTSTVNLRMLKKDYSISGKVLDSSGNPIAYAPVKAVDTSGNVTFGGTDSNGKYSVFVSAGTYTLTAMLPPDKSSECGSLTKSVTITTASKSSQNITPTSATCLTLTGTVTIDGSLQSNMFVIAEEWDGVNNRPAGGFFRETTTNSSGVYSLEVPAGAYRVFTFHPDYGELSASVTVDEDNEAANLNSGVLEVVTFTLTGGTAAMDGFIELKNTTDKHLRLGKPFSGATSNITMSVKAGTYNYFVNIFGYGEYSGTAATGDTVTIDVSGTNLVTLDGTIQDIDGNALQNAIVSVDDYTNNIHRDVKTDSTGAYSVEVKDGTYGISVKRNGFIGSEQTSTISGDTTVDFTGATDGLTEASNVVSGTVYEADGSTVMTEGYVWGETTGGVLVTAPIEADGTYTLLAPDDSGLVVSAAGPLFNEPSSSAKPVVNTTDGSPDTGQNLVLTSDPTRVKTSATGTFTASRGAIIDDTGDGETGIKVVIPGGAAGTSTNEYSYVIEQSYGIPRDSDYTPLDSKTYTVNIYDENDQSVRDFSGNLEINVSLDSTNYPGLIPADVEAGSYSFEGGGYSGCSGGLVVDTDNSTATCFTRHASDFALLAANDELAPSTPSGLAATAASSSQINLTWTQVAGSTSYDIYRSTSATGTFARLGSEPTVGSGSTTTYSDTTPSASTTYYYKISALNASGESAASSAVNATTSAAASTPGGGIVLPSGGGSSKKTADEDEDEAEECAEDAEECVEAAEEAVEGEAGAEAGDEGEGEAEVGAEVGAGPASTAAPAVEPPAEHWAKSYIEGLFTKNIITSALKAVYLYSPEDSITRAGLVEIMGHTYGWDVPDEVDAAPFKDVSPNALYAPYIKAAADMGVVEGFADGKFKPMDNVTRADALKFFVEASGEDVSDVTYDAGFPDVADDAWYAPYINFAASKGIVDGYADGTFGPDNYLTRGEIAKIASLFKDKGLVGFLMDLFMTM